MKTKIWFSIVLVVACLGALPLWAQSFPTTNGNDGPVASFGQFWILIDPPYQPLFAGCSAYNPATHVLQSPLLYDNITTLIGHSKGIKEGSPQDNGGVPVGSAGTIVRDAGMVVPPSFTPIAPGSNEVHAELRHLNLVTYSPPPLPPGNLARVRAGVCYNGTTCSSPPAPNRISRGEVVSNHTPAGTPPDFPARSYFNVFAQIDIPSCGGFPGTTVFNENPLLVQTASISGFPPSGVVYTHDASSAVGVKFLSGGAKWKNNQRLGCVILAGHGIAPTFLRRAATLENTPSVEPVAFQKESVPQREEKIRPPQLQKEEVDREAERFQQQMRGEFEREGGRHKDCGPKGKDE